MTDDDMLNSHCNSIEYCESDFASLSDLVYDLTEVTGIESSQWFAVRWEGLTGGPPLMRSGPCDKVCICKT